jgi:ubiquinol-cytochrome c reductase cytochrome b/c1 subunit
MRAVIICLTLFLASICAPATQANDALKHEEHPNRYDWSFAGVFGRYDTAQLRRGFKVYKEVCSTCHSIKMLAFRNLSQPGSTEFSEREIVELATSYKIKDGPNDSGEFFDRPGRPSDRFPAPFANEHAARAAMWCLYGAVPLVLASAAMTPTSPDCAAQKLENSHLIFVPAHDAAMVPSRTTMAARRVTA